MQNENNHKSNGTSKERPINESFSLKNNANKGGTPPKPQSTKIKNGGE